MISAIFIDFQLFDFLSTIIPVLLLSYQIFTLKTSPQHQCQETCQKPSI